MHLSDQAIAKPEDAAEATAGGLSARPAITHAVRSPRLAFHHHHVFRDDVAEARQVVPEFAERAEEPRSELAERLLPFRDAELRKIELDVVREEVEGVGPSRISADEVLLDRLEHLGFDRISCVAHRLVLSELTARRSGSAAHRGRDSPGDLEGEASPSLRAEETRPAAWLRLAALRDDARR